MAGKTLASIVFAAVLCFLVLGTRAPNLSAQPKEKPPEEAPAGPPGKYKIHQARLSTREDYTLLLDTTTGRTWVLGLSRDGSKLAWFDLGVPPLDNKAQERR